MDNLLKQTKSQPLFEDILWSRPQTKSGAGRLLIIGGNLHGFSSVAECYQASLSAGVGTVRMTLPDSLKKTVEAIFSEAIFAPSTHSGSFAQKALVDLLAENNWANGVLLAGNFGKNSETTILLNKFILKSDKPTVLVGDSLDHFMTNSSMLLQKDNVALVADFQQLQKLATSSKFTTAFTSNMGLILLAEALAEFSVIIKATIAILHENNLLVASSGQISSTKLEAVYSTEQIASKAVTVWLQNPSKVFQAITSSAII